MRTLRGSRALYDELRAVERHYPRTEAVVFELYEAGVGTSAHQTIVTIPEHPEHTLDVELQDVLWLEAHHYLRRWAFGPTWRLELL